MMCTQVRFCVWHATLLSASRRSVCSHQFFHVINFQFFLRRFRLYLGVFDASAYCTSETFKAFCRETVYDPTIVKFHIKYPYLTNVHVGELVKKKGEHS